MDLSKAIWRKTTDVNREHAIFELIFDGVILLDIGFSDDEVLEVAFHAGIENSVVQWDELYRVIEGGKQAAKNDR